MFSPRLFMTDFLILIIKIIILRGETIKDSSTVTGQHPSNFEESKKDEFPIFITKFILRKCDIHLPCYAMLRVGAKRTPFHF